jgi:hypothetical protein
MMDTDESGIVTLDEFLSFLRRDDRSEYEFARALRTAGTMGKAEYMRAIGGGGGSRPTEQKTSDSELQEAGFGTTKHSFLQRKVHQLPAPTWALTAGRRDESGAIHLAWDPPPRTSVSSHVDNYRVEWRVGELTDHSMAVLEQAGDWARLPEDQVAADSLRCASRRGKSSTEVTAVLPEVDLRQVRVKLMLYYVLH